MTEAIDARDIGAHRVHHAGAEERGAGKLEDGCGQGCRWVLRVAGGAGRGAAAPASCTQSVNRAAGQARGAAPAMTTACQVLRDREPTEEANELAWGSAGFDGVKARSC